MLRAIKRLFATAQEETLSVPAYERRQLELAVAVLLHEARRADYVEGDEESVPAEQALADIFRLGERESAALLKEGRAGGFRCRSASASSSTCGASPSRTGS